MSDSTSRDERISFPALSDGGQFGPTVDNKPPLFTFRFRLIKGLEPQAREDGLQLQGQNRDFRWR